MIGIFLLTQGQMGKAMIEAAEHMLATSIPKLNALQVNGSEAAH